MRVGLLILAGLLASGLRAAPPPAAAFSSASFDATWHDEARDRDVPVRIYYPYQAGKPAPGTFPVIIFSHGLGGTREGYTYLGRAWASHGYVSVHLQHIGSDDGAYKGSLRPLKKLKEAGIDPANNENRPLDIRFAIDRLFEMQKDPAFLLHGHMDLAHIGVAGHSFGAYTAMAIAGQAYEMGTGASNRSPDPRVSAAIAMSTPVPEAIVARGAFDHVTIPVFHMTGTKDVVGIAGESGGDASHRRIPYDRTTQAAAYLLTFQGGDHMVFSGRKIGSDRPHDEAFRRLVVEGSDAFWDGYLKGDRAALAWLQSGGFAADAGDLAVLEDKNL
jgi:predicted dienelactone hydrolase